MADLQSMVDVAHHVDRQVKNERRRMTAVLFVSLVVSFIVGIYSASWFGGNQTPDVTDPQLQKLIDVYTMMKDRWVFGQNYEDLETYLVTKAINGMMTPEVDPFSRYVEATGTSESKGLGIRVMAYDGYYIIDEVYQNTPADRAGLQTHDVITAVNGTSILGASLGTLTSLISAQDDVALTVLRNGATQVVNVTRSTYSANTVSASELTPSVGVLKVSSFTLHSANNTTATEAKAYLDQMVDKYATLIIDLRDNGGGSLDVLVALADLFLPKDQVVLKIKTIENDFDDQTYNEIYYTKDDQAYHFDHIIIMLNHNSASASEVFTLALNDNLPATQLWVMGTKSYGKGTAQQILPFTDGSSFRYTYAKWYSPNDISIHGIGITPEVEILETGVHLMDVQGGANIDAVLTELGYTTGIVSEKLVAFQTEQGFAAGDITGTYNERTAQRLTKIYYESMIAGRRQQLLDAVAALPH